MIEVKYSKCILYNWQLYKKKIPKHIEVKI
jgi:hypothetical protein